MSVVAAGCAVDHSLFLPYPVEAGFVVFQARNFLLNLLGSELRKQSKLLFQRTGTQRRRNYRMS